MTIVKFEFSLM